MLHELVQKMVKGIQSRISSKKGGMAESRDGGEEGTVDEDNQ